MGLRSPHLLDVPPAPPRVASQPCVRFLAAHRKESAARYGCARRWARQRPRPRQWPYRGWRDCLYTDTTLEGFHDGNSFNDPVNQDSQRGRPDQNVWIERNRARPSQTTVRSYETGSGQAARSLPKLHTRLSQLLSASWGVGQASACAHKRSDMLKRKCRDLHLRCSNLPSVGPKPAFKTFFTKLRCSSSCFRTSATRLTRMSCPFRSSWRRARGS